MSDQTPLPNKRTVSPRSKTLTFCIWPGDQLHLQTIIRHLAETDHGTGPLTVSSAIRWALLQCHGWIKEMKASGYNHGKRE